MMAKHDSQKAVLVGIYLPRVPSLEVEASLAELTRLVTTLGYEVVGRVTQKRASEHSASVLGEGKLKELAKWTGGSGEITAVVEHKLSKAAEKWREQKEENPEDEQDLESKDEFGSTIAEQVEGSADIVVVDFELSPSQIRNLESATGVTVLDRTGVIIEIFSRHARTKAARLQVEIAKLTYMAPRIRETGGNEDRGGGGVGGKGAGESTLELDRRKIRDRIKELKLELSTIGNEHQVRRSRREQEITVALVGYTNAGKSSLMRALTGSEVLVADKLFATLDTTIRPMSPETRPKILISDTVGFIKKLPHDLVASFKSTLDEALNASLLLYVVDAADPSFRSQLEVTKTVLQEVGQNESSDFSVPNLLVLNKRDRLNAEQCAQLQLEFPESILISTRSAEDLKLLREKIMNYFESDMTDVEIFVPYVAKGVVGEIRGKMRVLAEAYNEQGVNLKVRSSAEKIAQIRKLLSEKKPF